MLFLVAVCFCCVYLLFLVVVVAVVVMFVVYFCLLLLFVVMLSCCSCTNTTCCRCGLFLIASATAVVVDLSDHTLRRDAVKFLTCMRKTLKPVRSE